MGDDANPMDAALLTVGDEVLSGDIVNTNANWMANELSDRGVDVARVLTVPDDRTAIASYVERFSNRFDRVIVTGGIGGTPDDVTMEAVADAFDCGMEPTPRTRSAVRERIAALEERAPDLDVDIDVDAEAAIPTESRPLSNVEGLAPGCVLENVYVLPGIPGEMKAMFETVADEFTGTLRSTFLYTLEPEANIVDTLERGMDRYDVAIGCYPNHDAGHNRLKVTATESEPLQAAEAWLVDAVPASREEISRHEDGQSSP